MVPKFIEEVKAGSRVIVAFFPEGTHSKTITEAHKSVVATCKKDLNLDVPVFLFTFERTPKAKNVLLYLEVPEVFHSKFNAKQWATAVSTNLGGKEPGGRSLSVCQGKIPFAELEEGLEARVRNCALQFVMPHFK